MTNLIDRNENPFTGLLPYNGDAQGQGRPGRIYQDGVLLIGTSTGVAGVSNKVYLDGSLFTGTGTPGLSGRSYVNGSLV